MKSLILIVIAIVFSLDAQASESGAVPAVINVEGIKAQFLFDTVSEFANVKGLEGAVDAATGKYFAMLNGVVCEKNFSATPRITCSALASMSPKNKVTVDSRQLSAVIDLRSALIEVTGQLRTLKQSNVVQIQSIDCMVVGLNTQMDELEFEPSYSCTITL